MTSPLKFRVLTSLLTSHLSCVSPWTRQNFQAERLALWIGCLPFTLGVEGSTPTDGTRPNDFSDPIDQDIRTQCAPSWKIVVSVWQSVIAGSLNVGYETGIKVHVHANTLQK